MANPLEQGEIEALVKELETKMGRLRSIYEQYFMGIERMPPSTLRKDVVRLIYLLEGLYVRNTALKFKIRSLIQRFNSYKAYWTRVERQIEEGTYVRDIRRAERNRDKQRERSQRGSGMDDDGVIEIDFEDVADIDLQAEFAKMESAGDFEHPRATAVDEAERERVRQAKLAQISEQLGLGGDAPPPAAAAAERLAAAPASSRGAPQSLSKAASPGADRSQKLADIKRRMQERGAVPAAAAPAVSSPPATPRPAPPARGDDNARRVFDQLVEAKKRCNEPTSNLSYESVASSMEKQRKQLQEARGASNVEFKVVIKDGRAFLKPETK